MFGSEILEVAIGLVFVYLMFSLICSGVKEWIHHILSTRSKNLEDTIKKMLADPALVDEIYSHYLIENGKKRPSYIPPKSFSEALVDCIRKATVQKDKDASSKQLFEKIQAGVASIGIPKVRDTLTNFINAVETKEEETQEKLEKTLKTIETWFDGTMDKLSAFYRKKTKQLIFTFAVLVVVIFNVDTIMITRSLSQDPQLRSSVISQVQTVTQDKNIGNMTAADSKEYMRKLESLDNQLKSSGLPIGWDFSKSAVNNKSPRALPQKGDWLGWIYKVIGLLISVMAISMGAPFWYDVLRGLLRLSKGSKSGNEKISPNTISTIVEKVSAESEK